MARFKNALTGYFVAEWTPEITPEDINLELAKYISEVSPSTNENTEEVAYYDGDGTEQIDLISLTKGFEFTGLYDETDPAMKFIAEKEFALGDARYVAFKQVRSDGSALWARATVTAIEVTGGAASDYAPFSCTITWDKVPTLVPSPAQA